MIPSRGLRWSSQTIGTGRRRLDPLPIRQFSSSAVQNVPFRPNPLFSKHGASVLRSSQRPQFLQTNILIRNVAAVRFASTHPLPNAAAAAPAATTPAAPTPEIISASLDNAADFTSESLYNIPEHIGYLKELGLDHGWGPTTCMQWALEHVHVFAGTPWWVSIALTTLIVRAVLFKGYLGAADNAARMGAIRHLSQPLTTQMKAASLAKDNTKVMELRQELQYMHQRAGVKMWKSFVPMLQVFPGYGIWRCLRGMSALPVPGLEDGGMLWFTNLAIPDPYLLLPAITSGIMYWITKSGGEMGQATVSKRAQLVMRVIIPIFSFVFTFWLPAAVQVTFLTTSLVSATQVALFRNKAFRERFNMYPLEHHSPPASNQNTLKVLGPLSQADLNRTYNRPTATQIPEFKAGQQALRDSQPPAKRGTISKVLGGAVKDISGTFKEVKASSQDLLGSAKDYMKKQREKNDKRDAEAHEKKRQEQLKKERWQRENEMRASRAQKKARQKKMK